MPATEPSPGAGAGRDEQIAVVYLFHNGLVAVFDLDGQQMPQYQDPSPEARENLKAAYPERLWHAWQGPNLCRCGRTVAEHADGALTRARDRLRAGEDG